LLELEIVGRVGEDEVDAGRRQSPELGQAIADDDAVGGKAFTQLDTQARRGTLTQGHGTQLSQRSTTMPDTLAPNRAPCCRANSVPPARAAADRDRKSR